MSILSAPYFHDEEAAYEFVEARVWPDGRVCPHCGVVDGRGKLKGKSTRIGPAIDHDVGENRRAGKVPIPHVMMDGLEVPDPFARVEVDRDQAVGEQVIAVSMAAVIIARRHFDRQVGHAQLFVNGYLPPDAGVARISPGVVQPGIVAELIRLRDGVKDPETLAGAGVEAPDVPLGLLLGRRGPSRQMRGADEDDAIGNDRRGVEADLAGDEVELLIHALLQVQDPVGAEARDAPAGFGVERNQPVTRRDVDDPSRFRPFLPAV